MVRCERKNNSNLDLSMECFLDENKRKFVSSLILVLKNEETNKVKNVTCLIGSSVDCTLINLKIYLIIKPNFPNLNPGTNYSFQSKSYSSRIPNSEFNSEIIYFQTGIYLKKNN